MPPFSRLKARRFQRKCLLSGIVVSVAQGLLTCSHPPGEPAVPPEFAVRASYNWPTGSASSVSLDSTGLVNYLKTNPGVFSTLIVRDSLLLFEYYKNGFIKENDFDLRSASKSFISALVGIALERGVIDSLGQPVLSFFPDFDTTGIDPRKKLITLRHLLTMRAGFDYDEGGDYSLVYTATSNWPHVTLGLPLKFDPGSAFSYATPQTHLLSVILARKTGMSTYEFADRYLFEPLGISVRDWYKDPGGYYFGGTGMSFTARDFARFGYLYLRKGEAGGKRIIGENWIIESVQPRNLTSTSWGALDSVNYGYQWWTARTSSDSLFMASGYAGQYCFVIPSRSLIVVTTADPNVSPGVADQQGLFVVDVLVNNILPQL